MTETTFDQATFESERNRILCEGRRKEPGKKSPEELHHYTNLDAARNIVSKNSLWLFHASYCNDPTELNRGLKKMLDAAQDLKCTA